VLDSPPFEDENENENDDEEEPKNLFKKQEIGG
jgi:hypothetical protein